MMIGSRERQPIPTNEYGVVIPPPVEQCIGQGCRYISEGTTCRLTRHHLHSTEPLYVEAGEDAKDYRKLITLTVWLPRCIHDIHHATHELNVVVPRPKVMKEVVYETKRLKKLINNQAQIDGISTVLEEPDAHRNYKNGMLHAREKLMEVRQELFEDVAGIEVLPEQLVTGALLIAAPTLAYPRIINGSDYALTGTMPRYLAAEALALANAALEERTAALQPEVNQVELAA